MVLNFSIVCCTLQFVALETGKGEVTVVKVKATVDDVDHPMGSERDVIDNTIQYIKVGRWRWKTNMNIYLVESL